MNVLYVTRNLRDADFVEHELKKVAPQIQIVVSPWTDDIVAQVSVPGKFDALLLDPVLPGTECLSVVTRIRELRLPVATIVMTGQSDQNPPLSLLEAGADDYIVKRPHFVDMLPLLLQRVLERRAAEDHRRSQLMDRTSEGAASRDASFGGGAPRQGGTQPGEAARGGLGGRDAAAEDLEKKCATLEEALRVSENGYRRVMEQIRLELAELMSGRAEWERRQSEADSRRSALEEANRTLEARMAAMTEQHQAERDERERQLGDWQQRFDACKAEGEESARLRAALAELNQSTETRLAEAEHAHQAREAEWQESVRALQEEQQRTLEQRASEAEAGRQAALAELRQALESRAAEAEQAHKAREGEWEKSLQALREEHQRDLEQRVSLEETIRQLAARHAELEESQRGQAEEWNNARLAFEQERNAFVKQREELAGLHSAEAARSQSLEEALRAERSAWEQERRNLEQERQLLEEKCGGLGKALAESQAAQAQLANEQKADRANVTKAQEELERHRAARLALEDTLRAVETRQAKLMEEHRAQQAEWQALREELERQRAARLALEEALRSSEIRQTQLAEAYQAGRGELESLHQELESQRAARRALEEALRTAEAGVPAAPVPELGGAAARALADLVLPVSECGALLMDCLNEDDPKRQAASRLIEVASRNAELAYHLLALAPSPETVDLNLVAAQMQEELRRLAGNGVELNTISAPNLPAVLSRRPFAEQLLKAMVVFARLRLPLGGTISLETRAPGPGESPLPAPCVMVAATASGLGLRGPGDLLPLAPVVAACGGKSRAAGDADIGISLEVFLPSEA